MTENITSPSTGFKTGFLLINKPIGISSYDCIRALKRYLPKKIKIGHTGTLDDGASGILIICIGREATKMVNHYMGMDKEYVVKAKLGELTDSLDSQGKILETQEVSAFTQDQVLVAMQSLQPSYNQVPPVFSALKHQGQPLYALARKQQMTDSELESIVQQKARTVFIYDIKLVDYQHPFFTFRATVSKGTYVRSVANDIASRLGTVATVHELCRTKIGGVTLGDTVELGALKSSEDIENYLVSGEKLAVLFAYAKASAE